jgi:hypothetical protein
VGSTVLCGSLQRLYLKNWNADILCGGRRGKLPSNGYVAGGTAHIDEGCAEFVVLAGANF